MRKLLAPIPPGDILRDEFLEPLSLTQEQLARAIDVPQSRVSGIIRGSRAITADTALRLARYFGTSAEFWMNLQSEYALRCARADSGETINARITPRSAA